MCGSNPINTAVCVYVCVSQILTPATPLLLKKEIFLVSFKNLQCLVIQNYYSGLFYFIKEIDPKSETLVK